MNTIVKKVIVYSMIGILNIGLFATAAEASPRSEHSYRYERHEGNRSDRECRLREEHWRHEREMQRRHDEDARRWHERQEKERERHDKIVRTIGGIALLAMILDKD